MYVYLILSNIGNKPLFQWRQYAIQLLKTGCAHCEGSRTMHIVRYACLVPFPSGK